MSQITAICNTRLIHYPGCNRTVGYPGALEHKARALKIFGQMEQNNLSIASRNYIVSFIDSVMRVSKI